MENLNVDLVQQLFRALAKNDLETFLNGLAENVIWITPGPPETLPFAGKRYGREEVAKWYALLNESEELQLFEPREYIAQGDKIVVLGRSKIRIKSTEMILETDWVQVYTFHNNTIIQFQQYYDTAAEVAGHQATLAS